MCIGETLEEREADRRCLSSIGRLKEGLDGLSGDQVVSLVIAYEPVWAIGTGRNATPEQAAEAHAHIRGGCVAGSADRGRRLSRDLRRQRQAGNIARSRLSFPTWTVRWWAGRA